MKQGNYILWLPSWYPNRLQPFNGDFIQRHARAVAAFCPITVFHFVQDGGPENVSVQEDEVCTTGNLTEFIYYPRHRPTHFKIINRIAFNIRFYRQAKESLLRYFKEHGLPIGVHVHIPVKSGNLAIWIEKKWGVPFIVSEQSSHYICSSPDAFINKSPFYRWQVKRVFQNAAVATNVSTRIGKKIKELFQIKEVQTIHNLVETDLFSFEPKSNAQYTFIHVSSLTEQKNISGILAAFTQLATKNKNWKLNLVGPATEALRQNIAESGLHQNVQISGEVAYEEVAKQMKAANTFVLFSRHENFPCVIVEALCCGLPVVASDVAGIGEAVNDSNGLLVPESDIDALCAALEHILDQHLRYDRQKIANEASEKYNAKTIGSQIFNLYKRHFGAVQ